MPSILENLVLNSALAKDFLNPSLRTSVSIAFDTDVSIDGLSNQTFQIKNFFSRG